MKYGNPSVASVNSKKMLYSYNQRCWKIKYETSILKACIFFHFFLKFSSCLCHGRNHLLSIQAHTYTYTNTLSRHMRENNKILNNLKNRPNKPFVSFSRRPQAKLQWTEITWHLLSTYKGLALSSTAEWKDCMKEIKSLSQLVLNHRR